MKISSKDYATNKVYMMTTITLKKFILNNEEIQRLVKEAEYFKDVDEKEIRRLEAMENLKNHCLNMQNTFSSEMFKERVNSNCRVIIEQVFKKGIQWIEQNQLAQLEEI